MSLSLISGSRRVAPFGLDGGMSGACGENQLIRGDGTEGRFAWFGSAGAQGWGGDPNVDAWWGRIWSVCVMESLFWY